VLAIAEVVPAVGVQVPLLGPATARDLVTAIVPFLFIYAPVWLCTHRGVDSYAYGLSIPPFSDLRSWGRGAGLAALWMGILLVPWLIAYHGYQTLIFGLEPAARFPSDPTTLVLSQLFFVAIPEEFFYRGYLQTRLNEVFEKKFSLFGIPFSHALWITALIFAFGHSLVVLRWWHFAIFFPGLLFGLLREKTGGILAAAFFHALCNIIVQLLDTAYGVIPP